MATIDQIRNAGEKDLARRLKTLSKKHRKAIQNAMEQYGGLEQIPAAFWDSLQKEIEDENAAMLALIFIAAHDTTSRQLQVDRTKKEVEQKAQEFAIARSRAMGKSHVDHTRERLSHRLEVLSDKITTTVDQIRIAGEELKGILTDDRAENAATTETTSGISGGQIGSAEDYEADNPQDKVSYKWKTERDARVCLICKPLDGKLDHHWSTYFPGGPPAHPNCRCELILYVKSKSITTEQGRRLTDIPLSQRVGRLPELTRTVNVRR